MYQDFFNKNDDYLNEFKQKVANQKIATLEERRTELARSRNNFLGTFAGIALAGIVGWFILAPQYAETNKEIPVIRRPQTAVKIKPENPEGMQIPNQDKDVYNIVEKKNVDNTIVENLLPPPEQPKLPDIIAEEVPEEVSIVDIDNDDSEPDFVADEEPKVAEETTKTDDLVPAKPTDLLANTPASAPKENVKTAEKTPTKVEPKVEPVKSVAETVNGNWQIQLIASKNKDAVERAWKNLSAQYSDLQKLTHEIQASDLGSQGMFYRLRAGSYASKEAATAACASLKAKGLNDCIAKER